MEQKEEQRIKNIEIKKQKEIEERRRQQEEANGHRGLLYA